MLSCFVPLVVVAAIGQQAPDAASWLKAIPADVDMVARIRPLAKGQADLVAMIKAMSPTLAATAEPALMAGAPMLSGLFGGEATANTMIGVLKLKPGEPPSWAVLVKSDKYLATITAVAHNTGEMKIANLEGYDSFDTANGQKYFALKGSGFVALSTDEDAIKGMVKPTATIDSKMTGDLKEKFFSGDLGVFVNVAGLQARFGEQIDQAKAALLGNMDQVGAMMNNKMGDSLKDMIEGLFNAVKTGDTLALYVDFDPEGLTVGGLATVKPGASSSRASAPKLGEGEMLGRLPTGATTYTYLNLSPDAMSGFQKLGTAFMTGGGKPSPELQKALDMAREAAGSETYASTITSGMPSSITLTMPSDPKKAEDAARAILKLVASPDGFIKSVVIDPKTESYRGYTLARATTTLNLEKMTTPNLPGGAETLKKQLGGDTASSWFGTDGKKMISVSAKTWDEAKAQIDALSDGTGSIAPTTNFKAIRAKLPKQASAVILLSAQGIVKQMAGQMAMVTGGEAKVPDEMPKETTFFGAAVVSRADGFAFTFLLPSNNGPVFEKGLLPIFQGMRGGVNQ